MAMVDSSFIFIGFSPVPHPLLNNNNGRKFGITSAKRTQDSDSDSASSTQPNQFKFPSLRVSNPLLARSVVSVLGLGFVDAGYSGDWSRIGAITKETEDLLKIGALLVVPFCVFLVFSFSKYDSDSS
ncbi:uncharacterized protein LOC101206545 [Cucumis sativus]|uniref:DUF7887 domain-containing protein n=1 Tax=Cucumis sativus TaxID=3659 RepID=A0A0A0LWH4_CUCSA|nr:uncharacterized protein LOC101206545 [Cucumis sativus]KGN65187.1 hypothetical protein Csa_020133 [Cucumis sativus]